MKHLIAGLTSLFPVLGMVSPQPVGKGDIAAVTRVLTDYYNAFSTLDVQAILPYYHVPTWKTWQNLTMDHFRYVWATPRVHKAFMNSVFLALVGATVCMVLASLASYITVRTKIAARGVIEGLVFIPWAFPGTAMALGLLWAYVDFPIPVYATIWIILIALAAHRRSFHGAAPARLSRSSPHLNSIPTRA